MLGVWSAGGDGPHSMYSKSSEGNSSSTTISGSSRGPPPSQSRRTRVRLVQRETLHFHVHAHGSSKLAGVGGVLEAHVVHFRGLVWLLRAETDYLGNFARVRGYRQERIDTSDKELFYFKRKISFTRDRRLIRVIMFNSSRLAFSGLRTTELTLNSVNKMSKRTQRTLDFMLQPFY
jgi:hypothetical protein